MIQRSPRIARKLVGQGVKATGMHPAVLVEIGQVGDFFYRLVGKRDVEAMELREANDGDRVVEWVAK